MQKEMGSFEKGCPSLFVDRANNQIDKKIALKLYRKQIKSCQEIHIKG
jgi:hypothetical protein